MAKIIDMTNDRCDNRRGGSKRLSGGDVFKPLTKLTVSNPAGKMRFVTFTVGFDLPA